MLIFIEEGLMVQDWLFQFLYNYCCSLALRQQEMISAKNKQVKVNNRLYEVFFTTHDAQHISDHISAPYDPGSHLNFEEIEEVISTHKFLTNPRKELFYFMKKMNGKKSMVVTYLKGKRCIVKSGRICNFGYILNDPRWES